MIDNLLLVNYSKALQQKYNAVCFDIDGTLTLKNSSRIDPRVLPMIANILKKHVPIVFITGRGETGLKELLLDITDCLKSEYSVTNRQLLNVYALTNDGARLFMSTNDGSICGISKYISSEEDFIKLGELNSKILYLLDSSNLRNYCKISYSKDSITRRILNIRLTLKTHDNDINDHMIKIINYLVGEFKNSNLNLTIGIHGGEQILQIGTATKDKAIQIVEKLIGIPQNSMLRIGDCGDENGNDFSMLNCPQGFSVEKRNDVVDRCFPIFKDGKIITGVDATLHLLKEAKILPTICLEHATKDEYTKIYARMEKQMNQGKNSKIRVFNDLVNNKFQEVDGIYGLFDLSSGSVKIPMYEWVNIPDNNPLKKLWTVSGNYGFYYSMYDNENILLRGPRLYYYFLSYRNHDEKTGKDITSKNMVSDWLNNCDEFIYKTLVTINNFIDFKKINNAKMILGLVDNIRNILLIILNQQVVNYDVSKSAMINLDVLKQDSLIYKIYKNLINAEILMKSISFEEKYKINIADIKILFENTSLILKEFRTRFDGSFDKDDYSKDFRAYREIDNFAENYITCYLMSQKKQDFYNNGVCGLCYGGIELPIIMKSIDDRIKSVSILKFNSNVTGYSKKQTLELRYFDIFKNGGINLIGIDRGVDYVILDDNLLTGKTMQLAVTTLFDLGINVDKIVVVRYPGVNRIEQMFLSNHGAVDYKLFFEYIEGLYFPSPYSWRDPYSKNKYEDSLGVFDLNRKKIIECLIKNGDYSNKSEVALMRKFEKR